MKYTPIGKEVEAIQWTGSNKDAVMEFFRGEVNVEYDEEYRRIFFPLITGFHEHVPVGRWIVRLNTGSFKSFSDDEFYRLYEPAR